MSCDPDHLEGYLARKLREIEKRLSRLEHDLAHTSYEVERSYNEVQMVMDLGPIQGEAPKMAIAEVLPPPAMPSSP